MADAASAAAASIYGAGGPGSVVAIITQVANELGIDPALAIAIAKQESGLDPTAVGDNGTSFGLYQLHQGGELGSMAPNQAFDPMTNARVALAQVAAVAQAHPNWSPGQIAAAAQRPADQAGYANAINSIMGQGQVQPFTGGGGGGIGAGSSNAGAQPPAEPYNPNNKYDYPTPQEQQWIATNAPQYEFMLNDPQLANIIGYALKNQITSQQTLNGLLAGTDWYKTHSAAQREWIKTYGADRAGAFRTIQQSVQDIKDQAGSMGVQLTPDQTNYLAIQTNYMGWTPQELQREIGKYSSTGNPSATLSQLRENAASYLIPVANDQLQNWLTNINSGTSTMQQYQANLQQQAMTLYAKYPELTSAIQRGITPTQFLQPYQSAAANLLGVGSDSISFNDPKWAKAIFGAGQTNAGTQSSGSQYGGAMTGGIPDLYTFLNTVRSDPGYGYQYSQDAHQRAADFETNVLQTFGKI